MILTDRGTLVVSPESGSQSLSWANSPVIIPTSPGNEIAALEKLSISIQEPNSGESAPYLFLGDAFTNNPNSLLADALADRLTAEMKIRTLTLSPLLSFPQAFNPFRNQIVHSPYQSLFTNFIAGVGIACTASIGKLFGLGPSTAETSHLLSIQASVLEQWIAWSQPAFKTQPALNLLYLIDNIAAVNEFVAKYDYLEPLLLEAREKITEVFGKEIQVRLELFKDPESDGDPKLYAVILTPLGVEESMALEEKFDQDWWLDNLLRAHSKFNIGMDYV